MIRINVIWLQCSIRFQSFATINTCNFLIEGFSQICIFQTDAKYISINESNFYLLSLWYALLAGTTALLTMCIFQISVCWKKLQFRPLDLIFERDIGTCNRNIKTCQTFLHSYLYHFIHTGLSWLLNHVFS